MNLANISMLGWIHTVACVVSLGAGFAVLAMTKGTSRHRRLGRSYFYAMIVANVTALGLFAPVPGLHSKITDVFHWGAIATLAVLGVGFVAARRQSTAIWAYLHPTCMVLTYYALVGAAINEFFARTRGFNVIRPPMEVTITHVTALAIFIVILAYLLGKVSGQRVHMGVPTANLKSRAAS